MKKYIIFPLLVIGALLIASPAYAYGGRLGDSVWYDQYNSMDCGCTYSYGSNNYGYYNNTYGYGGGYYNNGYMPTNYMPNDYYMPSTYGYGYNNGYYNSNGAFVGGFLGSLAGAMINGGSYYRDQQYNFGGWDTGHNVYYNNNYNN
jgi:hypothetical protein